MKRMNIVSRALRYGLLLFVLCISTSQVTHAIDETFYSGNDILFYNPDAPDCAISETSSSTPVVSLSGNDNIEKAFNFFKSKGLSEIQAAGIMGNMIQESGVDPENTQTDFTPDRTKDPTKVSVNSKGEQGGWGIIQWTPASKIIPAAKAAGVSSPIYELGTQLEIVWGHLNNKPPITTGKFNISEFQQIAKLEDAVLYFEKHIEGAGDPQLGNRLIYANQVLNDYSNGDSNASSATITNSNPDDTCSSEEDSSGVDGSLGTGKGSYVDSGEVANWPTILNNARMSEAAFGDSLVQSGRCAAIVSRVWRNADIGYGYSWAEHAWYQNPSIRHADKNPKLGSILIFGTQSDNKAGHVVIYLGNNKILNDGHIADAATVDGWGGGTYLGWIDPNQLGWKTSKGTKESIRSAVQGGM